MINKRLANAVFTYAEAYRGTPNDAMAKKFLDETLAIDDTETKMRKDCAARLTDVLPALKAARYLQIENKIRAAIRYELAANIPLVE